MLPVCNAHVPLLDAGKCPCLNSDRSTFLAYCANSVWISRICTSVYAEAAIKGLEISPQAMSTAGSLASRVAAKSGAALLIDYGRSRPYPASLQAIRQHKFCGLLEQPGLADLSAHVDFGAIRYDCLLYWQHLAWQD